MGYRGLPSRIRWGGASLIANAVDIGYPLDAAVAYSQPREDSDFVKGAVEDAWVPGHEYFLEGDVRWIPGEDRTPPAQTGWDGDRGVDAALRWLREKNTARFYPDARNLLLNGEMTDGTLRAGGETVAAEWSDAARVGASALTITTEAGNGQKLDATVTGAGTYCIIGQEVPNLVAGETVTVAAEVLCVNASANANAVVDFGFNVAGGYLPTTYTTPGFTLCALSAPNGGWVRYSASGVVPAGYTWATIRLLALAATAAGGQVHMFVRNVSVRRDGSTAFVSGTPYCTVTLADPMAGAPDLEDDFTRRLRLKLRSTAPFTGY